MWYVEHAHLYFRKMLPVLDVNITFTYNGSMLETNQQIDIRDPNDKCNGELVLLQTRSDLFTISVMRKPKEESIQLVMRVAEVSRDQATESLRRRQGNLNRVLEDLAL
jgi:hypothetical protein